MTDTNLYRSTPRRRLVSESDNNPMNSNANNPQINPDWAESNPNVSVSGFTDESLYTGPGTLLQSQRNWSEVRVAGVMERFEGLKMETNE